VTIKVETRTIKVVKLSELIELIKSMPQLSPDTDKTLTEYLIRKEFGWVNEDYTLLTDFVDQIRHSYTWGDDFSKLVQKELEHEELHNIQVGLFS